MATDEHLDQELRDLRRAIRALDKEGVIEAYYQRLLSEIIAADKSRNDKANGRDNNPFRDNPAADADLTRGRVVPPDGEDDPQRRSSARRCSRLAQQITFFLVSGAAIAAAVIAGVFFVNRPRETLLGWGGRLGTLTRQTQMAIDRAPKIEVSVAIPPLPGAKSATASQSAVVQATTRADAEAATEAMPAPAVRPLVGVAPADKSPHSGVIAEKPGAALNATEAKSAAAVPASPERSSATVTAPAVQPAANASASASGSAVVARAAPAAPSLPATEIAVLLSRGDASLGSGDVTSARLFYQHAAEGGEGTAALRLGETFDPAFLAQAGLDDAEKAAFWYRRASELGIGDAALLLRNIAPSKQQ